MSIGSIADYQFVRKIAAGGMAEIFLARRWGSEGFFRDVVIKRLFRNWGEHPALLRMFQDEARLLAGVAHPNIPQVYELGYQDGYWFIAMEYVDGLTVADLWRLGVRSGQGMPLPVALGLAVQVCEALQHVHQRCDRAGNPLGIIHRDVTPQNIMVTRDGVAKLMDFGVAKSKVRQNTEPGSVRGTYSYMSPEQVRARPLDPRADVFSLGVILYELTTGTRLFRGTDVQVMTRVVEEDAPAPSRRVVGFPLELEAILMSALSRDPESRLESALEFSEKLEAFAIQRGLRWGPRAIAQHFAEIAPSEPVYDDALALVGAAQSLGDDVELSLASYDGQDAIPLPEIDEQGVMDDLDLLSVPELATPDPSVEVVVSEELESTSDASDAAMSEPLHQDSAEASLVLEGFDMDSAEEPILLLERPARATVIDPEGTPLEDDEPHDTLVGDQGDYLSKVARRLAETEDDETPD